MTKKLSPELVNLKAKQFEETVSHTFMIDGEVYEVVFDKKFSNTKIDEYMYKLQDLLLELKQKGTLTPDKYFTISQMLILHTFSDLEFELNLESLINYAQGLYDIGVLGELLNKVDNKEANKLSKKTEEYFNRLPELQKVVLAMMGHLKEEKKK